VPLDWSYALLGVYCGDVTYRLPFIEFGGRRYANIPNTHGTESIAVAILCKIPRGFQVMSNLLANILYTLSMHNIQAA